MKKFMSAMCMLVVSCQVVNAAEQRSVRKLRWHEYIPPVSSNKQGTVRKKKQTVRLSNKQKRELLKQADATAAETARLLARTNGIAEALNQVSQPARVHVTVPSQKDQVVPPVLQSSQADVLRQLELQRLFEARRTSQQNFNQEIDQIIQPVGQSQVAPSQVVSTMVPFYEQDFGYSNPIVDYTAPVVGYEDQQQEAINAIAREWQSDVNAQIEAENRAAQAEAARLAQVAQQEQEARQQQEAINAIAQAWHADVNAQVEAENRAAQAEAVRLAQVAQQEQEARQEQEAINAIAQAWQADVNAQVEAENRAAQAEAVRLAQIAHQQQESRQQEEDQLAHGYIKWLIFHNLDVFQKERNPIKQADGCNVLGVTFQSARMFDFILHLEKGTFAGFLEAAEYDLLRSYIGVILSRYQPYVAEITVRLTEESKK